MPDNLYTFVLKVSGSFPHVGNRHRPQELHTAVPSFLPGEGPDRYHLWGGRWTAAEFMDGWAPGMHRPRVRPKGLILKQLFLLLLSYPVLNPHLLLQTRDHRPRATLSLSHRTWHGWLSKGKHRFLEPRWGVRASVLQYIGTQPRALKRPQRVTITHLLFYQVVLLGCCWIQPARKQITSCPATPGSTVPSPGWRQLSWSSCKVLMLTECSWCGRARRGAGSMCSRSTSRASPRYGARRLGLHPGQIKGPEGPGPEPTFLLSL